MSFRFMLNNIYKIRIQTVESGTIVVTICFSSSVSDVDEWFSGSISMRCAFRQTTKSMMNARNIMPEVVPVRYNIKMNMYYIICEEEITY